MMKRGLMGFVLLFILISCSSVFGQGISVGIVNQDPDPVFAGEVVEVRFKIENYWKEIGDDVIVEIMPEYPFKLYSGEAVRNLGKLEGRQFGVDAVIVDYKLKVDEESVDGDHEIGFKVSVGEAIWYYDDTFYLDVEQEETILKAYVRSSDIIVPGIEGTISLEIANAGGRDVEFLQLELLKSEDYKLLSASNYIYLGNLESDDTESEDIDVYVPPDKTEVKVPIKLFYEVNDKNYEKKFDVKLNLLTKKEAKQIGLIKQSYGLPIFTAIIGVLVLFIIWRRKRKKKNV